jgi:hypothetical protein
VRLIRGARLIIAAPAARGRHRDESRWSTTAVISPSTDGRRQTSSVDIAISRA